MILRRSALLVAAAAILTLPTLGCERDISGLSPAPADTDPVVFVQGFGENVSWFSFDPAEGADVNALSPSTDGFDDASSLKISMREGFFAGGAFVSNPRDLSGYDALTFQAKSSIRSTFNVFGLGNDNTGTSLYDAERANVVLPANEWVKVILPIPNPARLTRERGLFFFAEAPEGGGHEVLIDNVVYEKTGVISNRRPTMQSQTVGAFLGGTVNVRGTQTVFSVDGQDVTMAHSSRYFDFASTNESVATVDAEGVIRVVGGGETTITATLAGVPVTGQITVSATPPPSEAAPIPDLPASAVVSIYSDSYATGIPVTTFDAAFGGSTADLTEFEIGGNATLAYTSLNFAAIPFVSNFDADAAGMTALHMDVYIVGPTVFRVKLVDFNGESFRSQDTVGFNSSSTPPIVANQWISLDIPLADFDNLTSTASLRQLLIEGVGNPRITAFVDNIYFHQ